MKTALYWSVVVEVVELFGYYALIRYQGMSSIVPLADLKFGGTN